MTTNLTNVTMMVGDGQPDQLSDHIRGDGYYGYRDGNHTISITFSDFIGRYQIEATLEINPTESDWFPIWLSARAPYLEIATPKRGTEAFTFQGNFVLLRFRKMRSYLQGNTTMGDIAKVMLSI